MLGPTPRIETFPTADADVISRKGETSVVKRLTFKNPDGSDHDITAKQFEYSFFRSNTLETLFFKLTVGSGLTIVDTNKLDVIISKTQSNRQVGNYFSQLKSVSEDWSYLVGLWELHTGKYKRRCETESEITVYPSGGQEVTIIVGGSGGGGDQILQSVTLEIEADDLRTIGSEPINLLEAMGVNIIHPVVGVSVFKTAGTTPYDFSAFAVMGNSTSTIPNIIINDDLNNEFDFFKHYNRQADAEVDNDDFVLTTEDGSDATQGDGTLTVILYYYVNDFN